MFPPLPEDLEPMPEVADHCILGDLLLPKGDQIARGHVVAKGHNANGNIMGRAQVTMMYEVEFGAGEITEITTNIISEVELAGGEITELTNNIIVESMYAQSNKDGNEH